LLNILPGVGLGDLITILLKNDVPLGQLLPNGYYKPLSPKQHVFLFQRDRSERQERGKKLSITTADLWEARQEQI